MPLSTTLPPTSHCSIHLRPCCCTCELCLPYLRGPALLLLFVFHLYYIYLFGVPSCALQHGGTCTEEFTCTDRLSDADGSACTCPNAVRDGCSSCTMKVGGPKWCVRHAYNMMPLHLHLCLPCPALNMLVHRTQLALFSVALLRTAYTRDRHL